MKTNNKIYISVLLSTYNDEKYIKKSIQSVLDQTYPYFEFIIINDGSIDSTIDIINTFNDERIILINKKNTGLIDSLNIGFSRSKYDWVMRMDGDDICSPNRLYTLVKNIENSIAVLGSQCELININDEIIGSTWLENEHDAILKRMQLQLPNIIHPSTLINKKLFNKAGGYDKFIYVAEDYDLWLRLSKLGSLRNIEEKLLKYRIHDQNISAKKRIIQHLNTEVAYYKFKNNINLIDNKIQYEKIKSLIEKNIFFKLSAYSINNKDSANLIISKSYTFLYIINILLLRISLKYNKKL